jgi:hypothetical protein
LNYIGGNQPTLLLIRNHSSRHQSLNQSGSSSIFLFQQLELLAGAQHHVGVAEPEWGLLITHKLQIHQPVVTGAAARLQLDLADGTFEATFVH